MKIIGCDFHPSFQQIAMVDTETGELTEHKLLHGEGEATRFYEKLEKPCLIGMEATGNSQWFERQMEEMGHELWMGDAAQIRASYIRKQKTDRRDAKHILKLLLEKRFPKIWVPSKEQRDQRQLLVHRLRLVRMRTRIKTELQHLAMNQGMQKSRQLWTVAGMAALNRLPLQGWTARRRKDLLEMLKTLEPWIAELDTAVNQAAAANPQACLLMTQPGVGPNTALAFVITLGDVSRFQRSRQLASYLGLIPEEDSSSHTRRLGSITKQGSILLRTLLVEAAQSAVRHDEVFRKQYRHRCQHKHKGVAKVAAARKLAVKLYWMLKNNLQSPCLQAVPIESSPSHSLVSQS